MLCFGKEQPPRCHNACDVARDGDDCQPVGKGRTHQRKQDHRDNNRQHKGNDAQLLAVFAPDHMHKFTQQVVGASVRRFKRGHGADVAKSCGRRNRGAGFFKGFVALHPSHHKDHTGHGQQQHRPDNAALEQCAARQ